MDTTRNPDLTISPRTAENGQNGPSGAVRPVPAAPRSPEVPSGRERGPVALRTDLPSREQLLILVDRTERHVLTPAETHLLRTGVKHLTAQLAGAGKAIYRLTAERDEARAERDTARREAAESSPTLVACPYCGVGAGVRCVSVKGALPPRTPHTARLDAASRWLFRQALGEAS